MQIPLVDLKEQYATIKEEIDTAIEAVISKTAFVGGPFVKEFEKAFASFCEARFAVGCGNGTDALRLALEALGVGRGDEVLLPSHTFFATAEAVLQLGAVPVFADLTKNGFTMDPQAIPALVTDRTRAVVPVHLYGHPCDMDPILEAAKANGLRVVEDCAQAHGARYKGRPVGTLGDAGCFSFYPGKNLGAYGDAGAVVTNQAGLAEVVSRLRDHARSGKYEHEGRGMNSRLDGVQAAILSAKLPHLAGWCEARRGVAAKYDRLLGGVAEVEVPRVAADVQHVFHLYVIRVRERDRILRQLHERGVGAGIHYPIPCHLQRPFLGADARASTSLPHTEAVVGDILSLPIYPEIRDEQIDYVVQSLRDALRAGS